MLFKDSNFENKKEFNYKRKSISYCTENKGDPRKKEWGLHIDDATVLLKYFHLSCEQGEMSRICVSFCELVYNFLILN